MVAVGEYYAKVKIGGQTLRVQIDTGSATLAVPLKECVNCKRGDMRYSIDDSTSGIAEHISCGSNDCSANTCSSMGCGKCSDKGACCAKSDPRYCAFHLNFGDGSGAQGILVRDILSWGDASFPVTFGGIRSDSPDFERSQVDGILGMAYPSLACNPSCIKPTFESMLQKYSMKDMFTVCITYDSGRMVLGDYDSSLSTKTDINWVPLDRLSPPTFYSFPLIGNLMVNEVDLPLPDYSRAIVDSGTTLIVFSHQTFDRFKSYLQTHFCSVPGLCDPDSWFKPAHCTKISDSDRMKLPNLKFRLSGFNLTLGPSEYLINYASKGPEFWCVGIMALDSMSGGVDVILGNTVMKKYVTIYDREDHRVGFVESDTKCGAIAKNNPAQTLTSDPNSNEGTSSGGSETTGSGSDSGSGTSTTNSTTPRGKEKGGNDNAEASGLAGNMAYVIGGAAVAIVASVALIAGLVHVYRKRNSANSESDSETKTPLANHEEVDTSAAFALDDDES